MSFCISVVIYHSFWSYLEKEKKTRQQRQTFFFYFEYQWMYYFEHTTHVISRPSTYGGHGSISLHLAATAYNIRLSVQLDAFFNLSASASTQIYSVADACPGQPDIRYPVYSFFQPPMQSLRPGIIIVVDPILVWQTAHGKLYWSYLLLSKRDFFMSISWTSKATPPTKALLLTFSSYAPHCGCFGRHRWLTADPDFM